MVVYFGFNATYMQSLGYAVFKQWELYVFNDASEEDVVDCESERAPSLRCELVSIVY
jgi:hypothetical protein